ncbi:acyltransferase family protein [Pseudoalteromonas sp. S16_S37]|uniref:acyltransferase family protein n=1 Tax=Pseudoalteromonas sp. S16_S37 TaxID=2720228 RepID=UPI0016804FE6|nr:acyltransferase [Pseudoalteromonas sp. S16_S37]MBD1584432.1 acyltransferase [Pseudoalteromonas sp. S16_S37]
MQTQEKVLSVESIRGWACFMVLISHLSLVFYPYLHSFFGKADQKAFPIQSFIHESPFGFFFSGTSAVYIFFVLSGYILTKVALKDQNRLGKVYSMALKRYPRLMIPALASCLIAYAAIKGVDISSPHLSDWINGYRHSQEFSLVDAIYNGAIDVFFISGESAYNPVLWTMKIELIGSFVVYALCLNRLTLKIPYLAVVFLILIVVGVQQQIVSPKLGLGLMSFFGGYFFSLYGKQLSTKIAFAFLLVGMYLAGAHNTSSSYQFIHMFLGNYTYNLANFMSGFFIVYAILFNSRLNSAFSGKLSVFMGKVSFSVYLIHIPIIATFSMFMFNNVFAITEHYNLSAMLTIISSIGVIYLFSLAFYYTVDAKGMALSNKFAKYMTSKFNMTLQASR